MLTSGQAPNPLFKVSPGGGLLVHRSFREGRLRVSFVQIISILIPKKQNYRPKTVALTKNLFLFLW